MWSDSIPRVRQHFKLLRHYGWGEADATPDSNIDQIIRLYDNLTAEMVNAIEIWLLRLIQNQYYVRQRIPTLNHALYAEMHDDMMNRIDEAVAEEVEHIPAFYFHVRGIVDQMQVYARMLRKDVHWNYMRFLHRRPDRKLRHIVLMNRDLLHAFERLDGKHGVLLKVLGEGAVDASLAQVRAASPSIVGLIAEGIFSGEEEELLRGILSE